MAVYQNVNGVIREVKNIYENVNGVIRQVNARYQNVNGVIRQTYGAQNAIIDANGYWKAPSDVVFYNYNGYSYEHSLIPYYKTSQYYHMYNIHINYGKYSAYIFFPTDKYKNKKVHIDYILTHTESNMGGLTVQISYANNNSSNVSDTWRNDIVGAQSEYDINKYGLTSNIEFTLAPSYIPVATNDQRYIAVCFETDSVSGETTDGAVDFGIQNMYIK